MKQTQTSNTLTPRTSPNILAIPSMPFQAWTEIYDLTTGIQEGTIFPDLNKPFFLGGVGDGR